MATLSLSVILRVSQGYLRTNDVTRKLGMRHNRPGGEDSDNPAGYPDDLEPGGTRNPDVGRAIMPSHVIALPMPTKPNNRVNG